MATVSVIMPAYNAQSTIAESIESVLLQSFQDFELLICDDSSSDGTLAIIKHYANVDERVKLVNNAYKKGAAGARNSCIEISKSRFIAFLDSDDLWDSTKLYEQVNFMIKHDLSMSHGEYVMFNRNGNIKKVYPKRTIGYSDIIKKCDIGCLTVMLDCSKIESVLFPDSPKEDYALWVVLMKAGYISKAYPGCHARYRKQEKSISSSKFKEISKQYFVLKNFSGLRTISRFYCIFTYAFNGLLKHFFRR
ncbi:glycosyltransferase family 2 protein [Vibrio navarrensis]